MRWTEITINNNAVLNFSMKDRMVKNIEYTIPGNGYSCTYKIVDITNDNKVKFSWKETRDGNTTSEMFSYYEKGLGKTKDTTGAGDISQELVYKERNGNKIYGIAIPAWAPDFSTLPQ
jgi:hypothetical protein